MKRFVPLVLLIASLAFFAGSLAAQRVQADGIVRRATAPLLAADSASAPTAATTNTPTQPPATATPPTTPTATPTTAGTRGPWYTSSFSTATYYYCAADPGWRSLNATYLRSYATEAELLAVWGSSRTKHPYPGC